MIDFPSAEPGGGPAPAVRGESVHGGSTPDAGDDATMVARCVAGDAAAWTALVHKYQRLVYAIPLRAGLEAQIACDVFQTVFTRIVEHLPRLADPARLQAWIVTTTKRETLRQLRRPHDTVSITRARDGHDEEADWDIADESPIAEEALAELQQLNRLRLAMERLDERSRALLGMLFCDEDERLPYEEVARRLGVPVGSIGPTRARCLEKLRRLMAVG